MTFEAAFSRFIQSQKVTGQGFQQPRRVKLPNGYSAFPCGYYVEFENGYRLIYSGATLGSTAIQEAMVLDPDGIPVARDTEDLREAEL